MRPTRVAVPLLALALVACSSSGSKVKATPAPTTTAPASPSPTPSPGPTPTPTHHTPGPNRPTEHLAPTPTRATTAIATPAPATTKPATTRTTAAQAPAARCPLRSGVQTIAGRTVIINLPTRFPAPVIIDFHGGNQSASQEHAYTGLGPAGAGSGYVVVTPNGTNGLWNFTGSEVGLPDDAGFTESIASYLAFGGCSDGRIYTAGVSDGADMAVAAACRVPAVRAVFAVAPSITPRGCTKKSFLEVHGTSDPVVPYNGSAAGSFGDSPSEPVMSRLPYWTSGCSGPAPGIQPAAGTVVQTWTCPGGRTASLYTVDGGGHTWPGAVGSEPVAGLGIRAIWSADSTAIAFFSKN